MSSLAHEFLSYKHSSNLCGTSPSAVPPSHAADATVPPVDSPPPPTTQVPIKVITLRGKQMLQIFIRLALLISHEQLPRRSWLSSVDPRTSIFPSCDRASLVCPPSNPPLQSVSRLWSFIIGFAGECHDSVSSRSCARYAMYTR